jgi:hypothetical protein
MASPKPPAALPAAAAAPAASSKPSATPTLPPSLHAQHWPADPALHPAAHVPLAVRLDGRCVRVDGVAVPLLSGLSPLAFVSSEDGKGGGGAAATTDDDDGSLVLGFAASSSTPTASEDIPLGALACTRFLAGARSKLWWMFPAWGSTGAAVPPETQFLLCEVGSGMYVALTPLIDAGSFRGTLRAAR